MKTISIFLKVLSFLILIFIWFFTILNFSNFPETIPIHYDLAGNPDGFGSRNTVWIEAGIATAMFVMLFAVSKKPNDPLLNIPQNIKENPILTELVVSIMLLIVMAMFGVISYESTLNALGKTKGLSLITNYLLGLMFWGIIVMLIYSYRLSRKKKMNF